MKNRKKFLRMCEKNYSEKSLALIKKSLEFIELHFADKKKISQKSLVDFNIDVGEILIDSKMSAEVVVAGVLYGIEKVVNFEEICDNFGAEVTGIVFGQLQFKIIKNNNKFIQAELIRKILLTSLEDVRIIFVKLAVKLANLRIIFALDEKDQKRIANGILDIYVPLAMRLGLGNIKNCLENLAFKTIQPRKYMEISNFFKESKKERENFIENFIEELKNFLAPDVSLLSIKGRNKQIKSIFEKIVNRGIPLKEQKDHYAIRIIVKDKRDCYNVLGILYKKYIPVRDRLKDYIVSPKPNGYQSIHTVLKSLDLKKIIEVQIRTEKMDEFAEEGTASYWSYKKINGDAAFEKKLGWLKALTELQRTSSNEEFMRSLKVDLFADKIYCYTPKGDAKELPINATLLDFAYLIHQEVGERAVGGRVDGKFVSLKKGLKNGNVVEILTNKNQRPRRDWLKFVISGRARSAIKRGIKRYESIPLPKISNIRIREGNDFDSLVYSSEFPHGKFLFAKCCYPLPKDELLGVMKSYREILVHRRDCLRVSKKLKNVVPVFWKETFNRPLSLRIFCRDRPGILADLLNTISRIGFSVKNAGIKVIGNDNVECNFTIIPKGLEEVYLMIKRVRNIRSVGRVFFG